MSRHEMWPSITVAHTVNVCQLLIPPRAVKKAGWPSWTFLKVAERRSKVDVAHTSGSHSLGGVKHSPSPLLPPRVYSWQDATPSLSALLLLVANQSSLTNSTFNPSLGPLVLPDGGGWVLAAVCDPTLINRVGEGKGAAHTPIHYLIRMAHSERWSPSLYLNDRGWTPRSVIHLVELLLSATTSIPSTCLFTLLHIKSQHFTRRLTEPSPANS